jgi:hypothetical protein
MKLLFCGTERGGRLLGMLLSIRRRMEYTNAVPFLLKLGYGKLYRKLRYYLFFIVSATRMATAKVLRLGGGSTCVMIIAYTQFPESRGLHRSPGSSLCFQLLYWLSGGI